MNWLCLWTDVYANEAMTCEWTDIYANQLMLCKRSDAIQKFIKHLKGMKHKRISILGLLS